MAGSLSGLVLMQMAESENWKSLIVILVLSSCDGVREESLDKFGLGQIESMEDPEIEPSLSFLNYQDHLVDPRLLHVAKMKKEECDLTSLRVTGYALIPWSSGSPGNQLSCVKQTLCGHRLISKLQQGTFALHYLRDANTENAKWPRMMII